jgi:hypothetical protein
MIAFSTSSFNNHLKIETQSMIMRNAPYASRIGGKKKELFVALKEDTSAAWIASRIM